MVAALVAAAVVGAALIGLVLVRVVSVRRVRLGAVRGRRRRRLLLLIGVIGVVALPSLGGVARGLGVFVITGFGLRLHRRLALAGVGVVVIGTQHALVAVAGRVVALGVTLRVVHPLVRRAMQPVAQSAPTLGAVPVVVAVVAVVRGGTAALAQGPCGGEAACPDNGGPRRHARQLGVELHVNPPVFRLGGIELRVRITRPPRASLRATH